MKTLVIFQDDERIRTYAIPSELVEPYEDCHGLVVGEGTPVQTFKIEHLAHMLGCEPFFAERVMGLEDFVRIKAEFERSHLEMDEQVFGAKEAEAPWIGYEFTQLDMDLGDVRRVIRTGWL